MHAYEYGIRKFNKKYQPAPNVTVFNDHIIFIDGTDKEADDQFVPQEPSIFSYRQVRHMFDNRYSYNLSEKKVIDGDLMQDYLIPNNYINIINEAIIVDVPELGNLDDPDYFYELTDVTIYEFEGNYYVKTNVASYGGAISEITVPSTKSKIFTQYEEKLKDLFNNPNISLIFFFSKDGAKLEASHLSIDDVKDNEIIFFLEKDDSYNIFGSVARVLSGKNIKDLSTIPYRAIANLGNVFDVNTKPKSIKKISKSHLKAKKRNEEKGIFYYLGKAVDFVQELTTTLIKESLGDGLIAFGNFISQDVQFAEKRWRYYDEYGDKNKDFAPIIPGFDTFLDFLDAAQKNVQKNSENFLTKLNKTEKNLKKSIRKVPVRSIRKYLNFQLTVIFDFIEYMRKLYDTVLEIITSKEIFIFLNALLIGLLNSLAAAIGGIITLIGYVLSLPYYLYQLKNVENKAGYVSMAMEVLETGIESVVKLFSIENIVAVISFVKSVPVLVYDFLKDPGAIFEEEKELKKVVRDADGNIIKNPPKKESSIQIDSIAYGLGYAIGFIVEEVVTTILTGGAKTIGEAIKVTIASFKAILKATGRIATEVVMSPIRIVEMFTFLFKKMRKLNVKKLLQDLYQWLKKVLLTGKQLLDDAYKKFFSKNAKSLKDQKYLAKRGYKPTSYTDNILTLCPIR